MVEPNLEHALLQIALDLCANLPEGKHNERLMLAIDQVFPCDACALLLLDGDSLIPVATKGLKPDVMDMTFELSAHPRLSAIISSKEPVRFPAFSTLADPFDGLLKNVHTKHLDVHACMGCSLYVEDVLVGVLTLDALQAHAFDKVSNVTVATFAALAAATLRNARLIERLEKKSHKHKQLAKALMKDVMGANELILGDSGSMQQLKSEIYMVAQSELSVLIQGETGTGKELVIKSLHHQSQRSKKPLVLVNCAALPESVAESELFGHAKGAFTGAHEQRTGKFELAHHGTLVLDEVGELPLSIQAKLLRALQTGEIQRVGSDKHVQVDVRVIAATNRDLQQEVDKGHFRADLFHRLCVFPIMVPPLRERLSDIPLLCDKFIEDAQLKIGASNLAIDSEAVKALQLYDWPGNVRELEHLILRGSLSATRRDSHEPVISTQDLPMIVEKVESVSHNNLVDIEKMPFKQATESFQKSLIRKSIEDNHGVWAKAAKQLQLDRSNLHRLAKRLNLIEEPS